MIRPVNPGRAKRSRMKLLPMKPQPPVTNRFFISPPCTRSTPPGFAHVDPDVFSLSHGIELFPDDIPLHAVWIALRTGRGRFENEFVMKIQETGADRIVRQLDDAF